MRVNTNTESDEQSNTVTRRAVVRHAGVGLIVGTALSGVAAADGDARKGKSDTAGRPRLVVSTPECETLRVEYVRGNSPVQVFVDGVQTLSTQLDDETRSVTWEVEPGEYTVTAKPGKGGSRGNPAVVVDGSPVTVEECETGLTAVFQCTQSGAGTYAVTNPNDVDATVRTVLSNPDFGTFTDTTTAAANATTTVPSQFAFSADGTWTHELSATLDDGEATPVTVNGESVFTNVPDCS